MKTRTISGAVYVAIIALFFVCRVFWRAVTFDLLLWFLFTAGTIEMIRATKALSLKKGRLLCVLFAFLLPVVYVLSEFWFYKVWALGISLVVIVGSLVALFFIKRATEGTNEQWGVSALCILYPAIGLLCAFVLNDVSGDRGFIGLLLVFVIPAFADTAAYLTGSFYDKLKKGQAKRVCPEISPNKTWAGVIGSIIGGAVAGLVVYAIFQPETAIDTIPLFFFAVIGAITGLISVFGDFVESYIKRKVGIKDMGRIMPGHGGVLDRIDGLSFVAIYILAMVCIM